MFFPRALGIALALASCGQAQAQTQTETPQSIAIGAQWWTGSLLAPSPASSRAGGVGMEAAVADKHGWGAFDGNGDLHLGPAATDQLRSTLAVTYGLTAQLSVQMVPALYHAGDGAAAYTGLGDLPLKLKYRFHEGRVGLWHPSFTASLGVTVPLGHYQRLGSARSGFGSGVYGGIAQLSLQSVFVAWDHPSRLRMWTTLGEPLDSVAVHDISSYGTAPGFVGTALPGATAQIGIGDEFALSRSWVVDLDLVQDFSRTAHLHAVGIVLPVTNTQAVSLSLAPAVEYNFSQSIGIIAGAEFSVRGRNSTATVIPEMELNTHF